MSPKEDHDQFTQILVNIAQDVGKTREGIDNLKKDFGKVKDRLDGTVTQHACNGKHEKLNKDLDNLKAEVIKEIKKAPSGTNYIALTPAVLKTLNEAKDRGDFTGPINIPQNPTLTVEGVEIALEERKANKAEKRKRVISFWLASIATASALIGGCVVGAYKVVLFMDKLKSTVDNQSQEIKEATKKSQRVVYVHTPDPNTLKSNDDSVDRYNSPTPKKKVVPKKK